MGDAIALLLRGDAELYGIIARTLAISGMATLVAMLRGRAARLRARAGPVSGADAAARRVNTGMGMPPVVVGLVVWLLLTRSGPFGDWG